MKNIYTLEIKSREQVEFIDITHQVQDLIKQKNIEEGVSYLFVPHTTAGITINENADPAVVGDMIMELNKIVPFNDNYLHAEGNSAAHIKASLVGVSETVIISEGSLVLGVWQGIYFCEFDGPRKRKVHLKLISG